MDLKIVPGLQSSWGLPSFIVGTGLWLLCFAVGSFPTVPCPERHLLQIAYVFTQRVEDDWVPGQKVNISYPEPSKQWRPVKESLLVLPYKWIGSELRM